jgi:hypothetical protein
MPLSRPIPELRAAVAAVLAQGWTQGALARDAVGQEVEPDSPDAVCWCLIGAMQRGAGPTYPNYAALRDTLRQDLGIRREFEALGEEVTLTRWNDTPGRTQAEVVALVRGQETR